MRHILSLCLTLLAAGCIDEPCDPGQELIVGLCQRVLPDGWVGDARVEDAGELDGAAEVSVPFNSVCSGDAECGGATNFCAVVPGEAAGFCTHTGCVEDPAVCPQDMTCLDLAPYGVPGLSICIGGGS
jgi:hypothetical protein